MPGDRGPQGLPGRDGKDLLATDAELNDLRDVFVEDSKVGQVLTYDGTTWVSRYVPQISKAAGGGGGAVSKLNDISDVYINNAAEGHVLSFNSANNRWESGNVDGGDFDPLLQVT